jgi:hypothetical protein
MLHCQYCSAMNDVVERVLSSVSHSVGAEAREKVRDYILLLASTGKSGKQLERFGKAYLEELFSPDRRYTGC